MRNNYKTLFLKLLRKCSNDKLYYHIRYLIKYKQILKLNHPKSFNEKINWLKLNDRNPLYSKLVDKYEVRNFVTNKIGKKYLNEVYGIYDNVNDINFDNLPKSFVLKATHGSSWGIICSDKSNLDIDLSKKTMKYWLNNNFYELWGEWVYKNVPHRIICEKYLSNENESSLLDYKFYCFHGQPKLIHVDLDRASNHSRNFYDVKWNRLDFGLYYPQADREVPKPTQLNKMIELAQKLSSDFKLVRVDFYQVKETVIFGELTFYPGNGLEKFKPSSYDIKYGEYLNLNFL